MKIIPVYIITVYWQYILVNIWYSTVNLSFGIIFAFVSNHVGRSGCDCRVASLLAVTGRGFPIIEKEIYSDERVICYALGI